MALQDEMTFQRIEVLLDMQAKKIHTELQQLREELSQVKEELRKEIKNVRQDAPYPQHQQAYAEPPQMQQQPVPRYAQAEQQPRYAQEGYGQPVYADAMPAGQRTRERPPENRPIDRNGVAPADVSVEKFFNFSGGKKK